MQNEGVRRKRSFLSILNEYKLTYILLSGAVIYTAVFAYAPMFGLIMAFQDFNIFRGFFGSEFVGFDNFVKIFTDRMFIRSIWNTLYFSSVTLFLGFPLPIILALMFNELRGRKFKRITQTISYMPHFLSWISVIALTYALFEMSGMFNDFRVFIMGEGTERINILMDPKYFLGVLFGTHVWKNVGWNSIIFLAAITTVDPVLYEAAKIDGCGKMKQIWHITLPGILPTIMIIFILASGSLVNSNFEQVFGLQNLFTQRDTEVVNTIVYRLGIQQARYSIATAFGLAQGLVAFIIVFVTNFISKKLSSIGIW